MRATWRADSPAAGPPELIRPQPPCGHARRSCSNRTRLRILASWLGGEHPGRRRLSRCRAAWLAICSPGRRSRATAPGERGCPGCSRPAAGLCTRWSTCRPPPCARWSPQPPTRTCRGECWASTGNSGTWANGRHPALAIQPAGSALAPMPVAGAGSQTLRAWRLEGRRAGRWSQFWSQFTPVRHRSPAATRIVFAQAMNGPGLR
jgi:hypothetical protein